MSDTWKETEKLVHLIEQSINPDSLVLHNERLPVIGSPSGRSRQCDVVIVTGSEKRKTISLVEVQERNAPVDINTFNGWIEKLREVGAQHLICVSRKEYPVSVVEKAAQLGSTVLLVTLNQTSNPDRIPLQLINSTATYSDFDVHTLRNMSLAYSREELVSAGLKREELPSGEIGLNDEVFSLDGVTPINLFNLARLQLERKGFKAPEEEEIWICEPSEVYIQVHGKALRLKELKFLVQWSHTLHDLPPTVMTYDQVNDGTLAWVLEFRFSSGEKSMTIKMPFTGGTDRLCLSGLHTQTSHDINLSVVKKSHGT